MIRDNVSLIMQYARDKVSPMEGEGLSDDVRVSVRSELKGSLFEFDVV